MRSSDTLSSPHHHHHHHHHHSNNIVHHGSDGRNIGEEEDEEEVTKGMDGIVVELDGKDLWSKFYSMQTEMVITKSGRSENIFF